MTAPTPTNFPSPLGRATTDKNDTYNDLTADETLTKVKQEFGDIRSKIKRLGELKQGPDLPVAEGFVEGLENAPPVPFSTERIKDEVKKKAQSEPNENVPPSSAPSR